VNNERCSYCKKPMIYCECCESHPVGFAKEEYKESDEIIDYGNIQNIKINKEIFEYVLNDNNKDKL
jgi:hypothetical protein